MPTESAAERARKEAYFTASQGQLIWARFRKNRSAMVAGFVLITMILIGLFASFLSPYDPTIAGADKEYKNGAPQIPMFCDDNGCSWVPFLHGVEMKLDTATLRRKPVVNPDVRRYLTLFPQGWEYRIGQFSLGGIGFNGIPVRTHLFGVEEGGIHLFGTDGQGKDIFSRTLHAIFTSLAVGTIGVVIAFVLALVIGGVAGYFGGWIDSVLQMFTDAIRTVPAIPLFMALAAFIPDTWSSETRFFFISCILGLIGWPTLARRVRTHLLTERTQEYVLAAQLCGASPGHVIRRHLLPSFTSYIIVDLVISFPYMVLSETALSFIGLGLKEPVNSLGVLLQNVSKSDVLLNFQWEFIPVIFFVALVLAFVFVGDGLRDAADPYASTRK
ncbi:ABC transporter permease [Rhodobacteraceae bacterium NNCM2]|nr:ABC transporter permease [Coraliihabitans acroporae]